MTQPRHLQKWLEAHNHKKMLDYHVGQFNSPYRSTVSFCDFLAVAGFLDATSSASVLDIGCGMGANDYYMATRFPRSSFLGIDINPDLIRLGNEALADKGSGNCRLEPGDLYALRRDLVGTLDGVISYQVLSWLPSLEAPVEAMARLDPKWIAASALFFDGDVSATIEVKDYTLPIEGSDHSVSFYNVYALRQTEHCFAKLGYTEFQYRRFDIDIDLPKSTDGGFGTYTEELSDGRRLQISGPILMSWYFIVASRPSQARALP